MNDVAIKPISRTQLADVLNRYLIRPDPVEATAIAAPPPPALAAFDPETYSDIFDAGDPEGELQLLVANLDASDYLGDAHPPKSRLKRQYSRTLKEARADKLKGTTTNLDEIGFVFSTHEIESYIRQQRRKYRAQDAAYSRAAA